MGSLQICHSKKVPFCEALLFSTKCNAGKPCAGRCTDGGTVLYFWVGRLATITFLMSPAGGYPVDRPSGLSLFSHKILITFSKIYESAMQISPRPRPRAETADWTDNGFLRGERPAAAVRRWIGRAAKLFTQRRRGRRKDA